MIKNSTLFFVKSHAIDCSDEIFRYLEEKLTDSGEFKIGDRKRVETILIPDFWREFYSHLAEKHPNALESTVQSYAYTEEG